MRTCNLSCQTKLCTLKLNDFFESNVIKKDALLILLVTHPGTIYLSQIHPQIRYAVYLFRLFCKHIESCNMSVREGPRHWNDRVRCELSSSARTIP